MTTATVTFTNSDTSNAIVLTILDADPPIIDVTIDSGHPYTTQALVLNRMYSMRLRKQGVAKTFFQTVTSNPFSRDLNVLFNTTPTTGRVIFTNSDSSNAITLSVKDDQGKTVVDDVSVTNSNAYVIDTLKLNATNSVHLKKEGSSDHDISLKITSSPFTYDVNTPFSNNATVVFTNSDKSNSITLSVLDDEGIPVVKNVIVSPGNKPYIAALQPEETYKLLLVKGTAEVESSVTINSNPFSYDLNTPFHYVQVTFTNSDQSKDILLSVPDGKGGYLIQDVSVTDSQPYITDILDLNQTYTLELKKGDKSAQLSLTITSNPFTYDVDTPFSNIATVIFTNSDKKSRSITLSVFKSGVPVIKDVVSQGNKPYIATLQLEETYKLLLVKGTAQVESFVTISSNPFSYDVNTRFYAQVMFTHSDDESHAISLSVPDGKGGYLIKDVSVSNSYPRITDILDLNQTYSLELRKDDKSAQLSVEIEYNPYYVNVNKPFEVNVLFTNTNLYTNVSLSVLDGGGVYLIKDFFLKYNMAYTTRDLQLNAIYTLELKEVVNGLSAQTSVTINSTPFRYDVHTPFYAEVTFSSSDPVFLSARDRNQRYVILNFAVEHGKPPTFKGLCLNATYTLEVKRLNETRQRTMTVTASRLDYSLDGIF